MDCPRCNGPGARRASYRLLAAMPFQTTGFVPIFRVYWRPRSGGGAIFVQSSEYNGAGTELLERPMAVAHVADAHGTHTTARQCSSGAPFILPAVEVRREGRVEPFLHAHPTLSSAAVGWAGLAVEDYSVPACIITRHEHVEHFLHVVLRGSTKCEVLTRGKTLKFAASPGTTFILPRGTVDEVRWEGPTCRIAVAIHPKLLVNAMDETAHQSDVELTEHWTLMDPHIMAVLCAMRADLDAGSPAGRLYGESLANALAVYLVQRYAAHSRSPV